MSLDPAISVEGLSKRYGISRHVGPVTVPLPFRGGFLDLRPDRRRDAEAELDDDDLDDEIEEEGEEVTQHRAREVWALRDVWLEVDQGAAVGLVGPNGAGKSALLKVFARIVPPTGGRVVLRGRVAPLLELASGLMHPDGTGPDNVRLLGRLFGVPREVVERRMAEVLRFASLEGFEHAQLKRYSSGMARRLAFSAALNLEPHILLADGVLGVGDRDFKERCIQRVQQANREGMTVLFASHDLSEVARVCREVVWMDNGRIRSRGPTEEVLAAYTAELSRQGSARTRDGDVPDWHGAIIDARVRSPEGEPIESLGRDESARIEIDVEVTTAAELAFSVLLQGDEGPPYKMVSPRDWRVDHRGVVTASAEVPAGTLRGGRYTALVGAFITAEGRSNKLTRSDAFVLDVDEDDDSEPLLTGGRRIALEARDWRLDS